MRVKIVTRFIFAILWILGWLPFLLPFEIKNFIATVVATVWFRLPFLKVRVVLHNLALVFPRRAQESMHDFQKRCEKLAKENLKHYVLCAFEILERFHWTQATVNERVEIVGGAEVLAKEKGYFFLTSHLGNWELITLVGVRVGIPLVILTKFLRNPLWNAVWVESRRKYGLELLEERGSGLGLVRSIRDKKAVGFILDQHTGAPHGIEARFLGQKAWCPKGLAILSDRLKAEVVPAYLLRKSDGKMKLIFEKALDFSKLEQVGQGFRAESGLLTEKGLLYHIQICNENMEKWILQVPEQYLWIHKRFKNIVDYKSLLPWQL